MSLNSIPSEHRLNLDCSFFPIILCIHSLSATMRWGILVWLIIVKHGLRFFFNKIVHLRIRCSWFNRRGGIAHFIYERRFSWTFLLFGAVTQMAWLFAMLLWGLSQKSMWLWMRVKLIRVRLWLTCWVDIWLRIWDRVRNWNRLVNWLGHLLTIWIEVLRLHLLWNLRGCCIWGIRWNIIKNSALFLLFLHQLLLVLSLLI